MRSNLHAHTSVFVGNGRFWNVTIDVANLRVTTVTGPLGTITPRKRMFRFDTRDGVRRYADRQIKTKITTGFDQVL